MKALLETLCLSPEAMAVLDEEFGKQERPLRPHVLGNPPPTEEEWKMQEAQRMLGEALIEETDAEN